MKRQQRVLQLLSQCCAEQGRGFDAAELADLLGAARHNVSADLNDLWRQGLVVKQPGRPVLFWHADIYRTLHGQVAEATGLVSPPAAADPLDRMIGSQDSLRNQADQAKAAVLYPPAGLHTLVIGPTGVGKSYLAELMHSFGVSSGRFPADAPFVTLNCADYANNPQLLMAHLFGAAKGAYTGADRERTGLVDHADGGILFLDEVHRLPAEGQEMLFRLIDKGLFRRLGETGPERSARVMLIAATTERIDSALLRTFARRIPMVIPLPPLAERTPAERLRFIRRFLKSEVRKIGVDIVVPRETLRMLLEYECLGNIGQLRNDIQLACARLFLSYLTHKRGPMELAPAHLPEHIHRTVPSARHRSMEAADLIRTQSDRLLIEKGAPADDDGDGGPISFYGLMERQMEDLRRQGMSSAEAEQVVRRNIAGHFKEFLDQVRHRHQSQRQELSKLVGPDVLRAVELAMVWAEERLGRALPERILYALALHIPASVERMRTGRSPDYHMQPPDDPPEAEVAVGIKSLIERELNCTLPDSDAAFVSMLLRADEETPPHEEVGVVVVAHGRVASAMTEVAHSLTGVDLACAIDMLLDDDPGLVMDRLVSMCKEGRFPGGMLLLADMGSLEALGEAVTQRTGVQVRTVGMVSTPLVVEAVHQAGVPGATLDQVYHAVLTSRAGILGRDGSQGQARVILTFCFTGAGSAHTLARIVHQALAGHASRVEVIPASFGTGAGWNRLVATLLRSHRLLAAVGPFHPRIPGIPYISTEEVVAGQGARLLRRLVEESTGRAEAMPEPVPPVDQTSIFTLMTNSLGDHLKVTNPSATVPAAVKGLRAIEQYLGYPLDDGLRVGLTMHLVCLLERKVTERLLEQDGLPVSIPVGAGTLPWLSEALKELTDTFHVRLTAEDLVRLDEILRGSVSAGLQVSS